ncbi:hypothetical protein [Poriferisphaera sp. WC338]|uniref:hypothetical protein n=1 Tax=Poriferisphaera sp. WC338 TaxID=3425129 RepID=UPI003D81A35F
MKKIIPVIMFVCLYLASSPLFAQAQPPVATTTRAAGITAKPVRLHIESAFPEAEGFDLPITTPSFNVTALLTLQHSDKMLIDIDLDRSHVIAFTDSTGQSLIAPLKDVPHAMTAMPEQPSIESPFGISKDGKHLLLEFAAPKLPAAGAVSVHLAAAIHLHTANGIRSVTLPNIPMKKGVITSQGSQSISITDIQPATWDRAERIVSLAMPEHTAEQIHKIIFFDVAGKNITGQHIATLTQLNQTQMDIALTDAADIASVQIQFYENIESLTVPINLTVGLSLSNR